MQIEPLVVLVEDIQALTDEDYALARRQGLGASDSSIILGVNPYKKKEDLIVEKRSRTITDEERKIKDKDVVRKGFDLEPLILQKFAKLHNCAEPIKPVSMYQIEKYPQLTINFDGLIVEHGIVIPVEAKFVSTYGDKYYKREHALRREFKDAKHVTRSIRPYTDTVDRIKAKAEQIGIPPYYYTQIQQQLLGLDAPYGYLVALHDKGWETVIYHIPRDEECIRALIIDSTKLWQKIKR